MTTPPTRRQRWRDRKRYRRTTAVLAAAAAVLLGGGVAAGTWWTTQQDDEATVSPGTYVPPSSIMPTSQTPSTPTATTAKKTSKKKTSSSTSAPTSTSSSSSASALAPAVQAPQGSPTRVQVTSGGRELVNASLEATKLDAQKVLAPPYGTAGWYAEPGWPKPGHKGASILVGHINSGGNPDVFWNLPSVKLGDLVTVTYGSGEQVKFKITRSEAAPKTGVPKDDTIWDWDNPKPVLRLITCDPETPLKGGHYEGNWVVWADQMVS
ncbi:class F sortase [Janibacter limosus]|uniref:Class F sortase n=1 Tax=Janibacter limosus TaxID=53458 RepID=A0A4P6MR55_9MICO|nr:class F sortase [Janibacter limosus]QBF45072.1 class F sortase [Janibacter limosus]